MKRLIGLLLFGSLLSLSACGTPSKPHPAALTLTPTTGTPGTILTLTGLELEPDTAFEVWVGPAHAPARLNTDGSIAAAIPLFLDENGWPNPPTTPQKVEVRHAGRVLGQTRETLTLNPLKPAPGSTQAVTDALADIAHAYSTLFAALPSRDPADLAIRDAVVSALDGLINSDGNSLQAMLDGNAPQLGGQKVDVGLLDALLATSGARDYFENYAAALTHQSATLKTQASAYCNTAGADFDLACQMQIYVVLDDYSKAFVKPTAEAYANTLGLEFGLLAVAGKEYPPAAVIGAILSIADFVMEKIAPALFPSVLSQFELQMPDTSIELGAMTDSKILVSATNNPPPITYLDMIEQVKTLAGLKNIEFNSELNAALKAAADLFIDLYLKVVKSYETAHPGSYPWVSAGDVRIPKMSWGPVQVTSDRLVELFSFDESTVATQPTELEWQGVQLGRATVRIMPRGPGEKSKVLMDNALCWGCVYYGGAFGNSMPESKTEVKVGNVQLTASPAQGTAPLRVTFTWTGITPQDKPLTCILDTGDGTPPYTIPDCATTTTLQHTYAYTAALHTKTDAYTATLTIRDTTVTETLTIPVAWRFTATPATGTPPFETSFDWGGFDPALAPLACSFDPGDGSATQELTDCLAIHHLTHHYTDSGTFIASLTMRGNANHSIRTTPITSQATPTCIDPTQIAGWQGTVTLHYETTNIKRTANVQVRLDTLIQTAGGPVWRGSITGGSALFDDANADHSAYSATLNTTKSAAAIEFTAPGGTCRFYLSTKVAVAGVTVTDNDFSITYDYATAGTIELLEPVTSQTNLHGDALLPVFPTETAEGYVDLNDEWNPPIGLEFAEPTTGTASVTWDLTPIPPSP